jgi:hypothetical protein
MHRARWPAGRRREAGFSVSRPDGPSGSVAPHLAGTLALPGLTVDVIVSTGPAQAPTTTTTTPPNQ